MEKMKENDKWNSEKRRACLDGLESPLRDFPGGPVVKASPSSASIAGLIPGWELRSHLLATKNPKRKTEWIL